MSGETERDAVSRRFSPWPVFIAFGLALGELGVFLGIIPLAVGGVALFGGSCAGAVTDAGYAATPWRPLALFGLVFVVLGGLLWVVVAPTVTVRALVGLPATNLVARRGAAVLLAGLGLVVLAGVGSRWRSWPLE